MLFEAVLALLLIALLATLYVMVSVNEKAGDRGVSGIIAAPQTGPFVAPGSYGNMFAGDNGTLYSVDGRHVNAVDVNGSILWSLDIPGQYRLASYGNGSGSATRSSGQRQVTYSEVINNDIVTTSGQPWYSNSAVVKDGNLYILLNVGDPVLVSGVLLAVSSSGSLLWDVPFAGGYTDKYHYQYGLGILQGVTLHGKVIYVYSGYGSGGVTFIGMNGSIIGCIGNMTWEAGAGGMPAIGDDGTLYVRRAQYASGPVMPGKIAPSVEAYWPNGTMIWRHGMDEFGINETMMSLTILAKQPYLRNGTLYVWSNDGFAALEPNGSLRSRYHIPEGFVNGYGFDREDTLYLSYSAINDPGQFPFSYNRTFTVLIRPDGTIEKSLSGDNAYSLGGIQEFPDDVLYQVKKQIPFGDTYVTKMDMYNYTPYNDMLVFQYLKNNSGRWGYPRNITDLDIFEVIATDLATGEQLWSCRLHADQKSTVLDRDNAVKLTAEAKSIDDVNHASRDLWYVSSGIPQGSTGIRGNSWAYLEPDNDTLYVSAWSCNYEYPPFYGRARCVYAGGIYELYLNGTLKSFTSTDSRIVSVQEVNGTVYYGTGDGKISAIRAGEIAGMFTAAVSAAYLFLRFFLFGAVTRTRARLEKNANRNRILEYIRGNPGVSLFDIAQALAMNPGTVRYHLMILGVNHCITSFRADEKFVRYFVNSGTYGQGDQLVISLMRREPLRRIIDLLRERPGMSNLEMSRELDAHESSTMRNVKLLIEKGIVAKSLLPDGKISYSLSSEYVVRTVSAFELLNK